MSDPILEPAKRDMLRRQLQRRGITDRRTLAAMEKVPRERFVPEALHAQAYSDRALAIECDQTISQPYIVALMTEALSLQGSERVLEIGTGSGYQTAVLAEIAAEVVSIERHERLSQQAGVVLGLLGYRNVTLVVGDGTLGCPSRAPFDRIIVTAAAERCPPALIEQLLEGGILVIPLGGQEAQTLEAIRRQAGALRRRRLSGCRFVPLVGQQAWPE